MLPDSTRLIEHFSPKFEAQNAALIQQVEAIDKIAQSAALHADQAIKQTNTSKENLALFKEQVESLFSIAQDAKSQAVSARKELDILKQQLDFVRSEAESAKKDALFAKNHFYTGNYHQYCDTDTNSMMKRITLIVKAARENHSALTALFSGFLYVCNYLSDFL